MKKKFVFCCVIGWFFIASTQSSCNKETKQFGPFRTESECEKTRSTFMWHNLYGECWSN